MDKKKISITIPVYNESENLIVAVETVEKIFQTRLTQYELEIIVTDNASTDNSWSVIQKLAATRSHFKAYQLSRNFGYQNSVFAGLSLATGDAAIELDADLEDPPHVIPEFVKKWEEGFEVVYGVRKKRYGSFIRRFFFSRFYWFVNLISEYSLPVNSGDFRLLDRKVLNALIALPERNLYLRGLVVFLGFRQTPVYYDRQPRISGESKFRFLHYVALGIDAITAFTKAPLRLMSFLGCILFLISLCLGIYYLFSHVFHGTPVPGFTTLVVLTLGLHSISFIFIGILGEYMSRIFDDSKNRPRAIISQAVNSEKHPHFL